MCNFLWCWWHCSVAINLGIRWPNNSECGIFHLLLFLLLRVWCHFLIPTYSACTSYLCCTIMEVASSVVHWLAFIWRVPGRARSLLEGFLGFPKFSGKCQDHNDLWQYGCSQWHVGIVWLVSHLSTFAHMSLVASAFSCWRHA